MKLQEAPTVVPIDRRVPLESVLCTEELARRPARSPDYQMENRALVSLAQALADSPSTILQKLVDHLLPLFQAGSAGISLLTESDGGKRFYWPAIAGVWKTQIGNGTPRDFSPCGDVLDRSAPLLFSHLERRYTYFQAVASVEEALLVPFYLSGKAVGTVWVVIHDGRRRFDAEDLRQLVSLGRFASSAYQAVVSAEELKQKDEALRRNQAELIQSMAQARKASGNAQDARLAALNMMEDAVQSRDLLNTLNLKLCAEIAERVQVEESLRHAQDQLAAHGAQLEQTVAERTAQLQETIGELEHFSYTITHDMRAPLRSMQGFSGLLLSQPPEGLTPKSVDYLTRIMDGAQRMDALLRDALQFAKVVREKIPLAPINPVPVLQGILETYSALWSPQTVIKIIPPLPFVMANDAGLGQCFSNILINAIKFVKAGTVPEVRIWAEIIAPRPAGEPRAQTARPTHSQASTAASETSPEATVDAPFQHSIVRFWFEDNGIGIPPEYQERIFDMFQQLDKTYDGTGIGLALVRKTAQRMGGKVGVVSEPGKGSRFWLEFELAEP